MSNDRREYNTGAVRSADCEQTRYDLITPVGLKAVARTYAEGMQKFGYCNWENGMPVTDLLNHAIAHIYNFLGGDRSEDHLAHATWNLLGAVHSMELWPELNKQWLRTENCGAPPVAKTATTAPPCSVATPAACPAPPAGEQSTSQFEELRKNIFAKK